MTRTRWFLLGGLVVALLLGGVLSYYASSQPDGLNKVAADHGFAGQERSHATSDSPLAGYSTKGIGNERLSGGVAVGAGVLICFAIGGGLFWGVSRRTRPLTSTGQSVSAGQQ